MGRQGKHPEPGWKGRFLEAYEKFGTAFKACKVAGISRETAFKHKREDPEFRARWDELEEVATDRLEDSCYERAVDGWDEPVYQGGEMVGVIRRFDNNLAWRLLSRRSKKYHQEDPQKIVVVDRTAEAEAARAWAAAAATMPSAGMVLQGNEQHQPKEAPDAGGS